MSTHAIWLAAVCFACGLSLRAEEAAPISSTAETYEFATIKVRAAKPGQGARYTASADELKKQNIANIEDSFKYLPNVFVRKRYIGDANGVLQLRGTGMWQTGRSQVLADGYLPLSFHLQTRFNGAPRWNLVSVNEVLSTEVDFGPFNPAFGGSSMGGVVNFVTRQPQQREVTLNVDSFMEEYNEYGSHELFEGNKVNLSYADRWGRFSSFLFVDHLKNLSHPMSFSSTTITAVPSGQKVGNGAFVDQDPQGRGRVIYGETGPEDVTQDLLKWKLGFDGGRAFRAQATVAYNVFQRDSTKADSYIYASTGARVWGDKNNSTKDVQVAGNAISVDNSQFGVSVQERHNLLTGLSFKGTLGDDLDYETGGSLFRVLRDITKASNENPADPLYNGKGKITRYEDTGWETVFARLGHARLLDGRLGLLGGLSYEHYQQASVTHNNNDWRGGDNASFSDLSAGNTFNEALFGQAAVGLLETLDLTLGWRHEWWGTYGAVRRSPAKNGQDAERWDGRSSPKAVLAWTPGAGFEARLAAAKAYRFPIVEELYQNRFSQTSSTLSNADLRPEDGTFYNLGFTQRFGPGLASLNFYREDVLDSIFTFTDQATSISTTLNMDHVVTNGVDGALRVDGLFGTRFDLALNGAYNDARIIENARDPRLVGNSFQRVPQWRTGVGLTRHFTERFQATLHGRYSSHSFNNVENDDTRDVYGAVSSFLVADLSALYQVDERFSLRLGIDNIAGHQYYNAHPMPQRSYSVGAKAAF